MGFTSTNRISSIAPIDESESDISFLNSLDESESYSGLLSTNIEILENDLNIFNNIIELDFISSMNEMMMLDQSINEAANEDKVEKLINNCEKVSIAAKKTIETAALKKHKKIVKFYEKNANKFETATKVLNMKNLEGFPGINNVILLDEKFIISKQSLRNPSNFIKEYIIALNKIINSFDKTEIVSIYKKCKIKLKVNKFINFAYKNTYAKKGYKVFIPNESDLKLMINFAKKNTSSANLSATTSNYSDCLSNILKISKESIEKCKKQSQNEMTAIKANYIYRITSFIVRGIISFYNSYCDLLIIRMANYRKAIVACSSYATKKSSINEAILYALAESSDAYTFEFFGKED